MGHKYSKEAELGGPALRREGGLVGELGLILLVGEEKLGRRWVVVLRLVVLGLLDVHGVVAGSCRSTQAARGRASWCCWW